MNQPDHSIHQMAVSKQSDKRFLEFRFWFLLSMTIACASLFVAISWWDLDRAISRLCYDQTHGRWPWVDQEPFSTIDHWSVHLATVLGVGSYVLYVVTWFVKRNGWWNRAGLGMTLLVLLGPVLLVNGMMKPTFARARPREITEFGGKYQYTEAWRRSESPFRNSSFPSGHASIGFYFLGPALLLRRGLTRFAWLFSGGILAGCLVGYSRIVQGGHFISDVLCSLLLMMVLGWVVSDLLFRWWPVREDVALEDDDKEKMTFAKAA